MILFSLCIVIIAAACTTPPKHHGYTVKGTVTGVESNWVKLFKLNFAYREVPMDVIDSVQVQGQNL